jgi:hypothetical protein
MVAGLVKHKAGFLHFLWDRVGDRAAEQGGDEARLSPEGLALTIREVDSLTLALVVTMPPPEIQTEAYFVGMVVGPKGRAAYWTLEKASPVLGPASGVHLCQWNERGVHALLKADVQPTLESFVGAIT